MATFKDGAYGTFNGKIGNYVSYTLRGKNVIRRIGKSNKPPTIPQLAVRLKMKLAANFLQPMLQFINLGFAHAVEGTDKHPHNEATSYLTKKAMIGDYPDINIDYSKVLVSMGNLQPAVNPAVNVLTDAIEFTWEVAPGMNSRIKNDRAMLLIYFPVENEAIYVLSGAQRIAGRDAIQLPPDYLTRDMHTYMAFMADDRKSVSNSVYAG